MAVWSRVRVSDHGLARWLSKSYRVLGALVLLASFATTTVIMFAASLNGLMLHEYVVPVYTNSYGEDWLEVIVIVVAIPSIALWFKRVVDEM